MASLFAHCFINIVGKITFYPFILLAYSIVVNNDVETESIQGNTFCDISHSTNVLAIHVKFNKSDICNLSTKVGTWLFI